MKQIILDAAHGIDVEGKRSPDGTHREYIWSRDRIKSLKLKLEALGFDVVESNQSIKEIGLGERIAATNRLTKGKDSIFISLHNDAAGNGREWMTATGYSIFTTKGNTKSDEFAELLMKEFAKEFPELKARVDKSDGDLDKEENFAVLKCSCPAVLIEWLFQDNKKDLELLKNSEYNNRYENCIINVLKKW